MSEKTETKITKKIKIKESIKNIDSTTKASWLLIKLRSIRKGLPFIALGTILILSSILLDEKLVVKTHSELICIQFLSHIGIGLLVIGIMGIVIESDHWRNYFEERLSKIVIEKEHLSKLDPEALINLQTQVLKAYYKNNDIGGSDGFLKFYQKNIQSYVSSPFRTDANMNMKIRTIQDKPDCLLIAETMSCLYKSNGQKFQKEIKWDPCEDEVEKVNKFEVIIQQKGSERKEYNHAYLQKEKCIFDNKKLIFEFKKHLKDDNLDELYVTIIVEYVILKERFISWRMSLPTRRAYLTVQYPEEFKIFTEKYFNDKSSFESGNNEHKGYYYLNIEDWIMPDQGLSFQLYK